MSESRIPLTFSAPDGLKKINGKTIAKVTHAELVDSHFGGKQVKFEWITKKQNRIVTYLTPTSASMVRQYINVHVLYYTDETEQMIGVVDPSEQPFVWIELKEGKVVSITEYNSDL